MASDELVIIQIILSIAISVGGGTFLGFYLSQYSRKVEEKEIIKKTKKLLSKDFSEISKLVVIQAFYQKKLIFNIDEIAPKIVSGEFDYSINLTPVYIRRYPFVFWNAIVSSTSLIKLKIDEIQKTQRVHDLIESHNEHVIKERDDFLHRLMNYLNSNDDDIEKAKVIKTVTVNVVLESLLNEYYMYKQILSLETLDWITIEHSPEMEKFPFSEEEIQEIRTNADNEAKAI